jgi:hypothetical protein
MGSSRIGVGHHFVPEIKAYIVFVINLGSMPFPSLFRKSVIHWIVGDFIFL